MNGQKVASLHALIVDESRATRLVMRKYLSDLGIAVTEAADATEAHHILEHESKFSVLFVDSNLPGMSGLDFIRKVRSNPAHAATSMVVISTLTSTDGMSQALEAGANEYIMKPFTQEMLAMKLDLLGIDHG